MPYFPDELRKSVIFLGYMSQSGKEEFAGSGFLVRLGHEDSTYVVTAAHVIDKIKEKSRSNDLHVRMRVNL